MGCHGGGTVGEGGAEGRVGRPSQGQVGELLPAPWRRGRAAIARAAGGAVPCVGPVGSSGRRGGGGQGPAYSWTLSSPFTACLLREHRPGYFQGRKRDGGVDGSFCGQGLVIQKVAHLK